MQILKKLALHQVVSHDASETMIGIMKQQYFNEGIPALLPSDVSIAHKNGWIERIYHDAGIIFPLNQTPYVLVVMTSGLSEDKEAPLFVSSLSKFIFDHHLEWR